KITRLPPPGATSCPHRSGAPARRRTSDVEAESAQLLATFIRDLVRPPRRHPDPVDPHVRDHAATWTLEQHRPCLILDHIGEWARCRGERHVQCGYVRVVHVDAVQEAEVD